MESESLGVVSRNLLTLQVILTYAKVLETLTGLDINLSLKIPTDYSKL